MSKTSYRPGRNRRIAQLGALGAPFRGVFNTVVFTMDAGAGTAVIYAMKQSGLGGVDPQEMWVPGRVIDPAAFSVEDSSGPIAITSAVVQPGGFAIAVAWLSNAASTGIMVVAGHPALVANNGQSCGGAFLAGV